MCHHLIPNMSSGILTWFPFRIQRIKLLEDNSYLTWLNYSLGLTHSWPTTVLMKPFPTSAFKFLTWIFTTITKICTRIFSSCGHPPITFIKYSTYVYSYDQSTFSHMAQYKLLMYRFKRHPFSGLIHLAGKLLHTS